MKAQYVTNCVSSTSALITPMVDAAIEISWRTFKKHCDWQSVVQELGYAVDRHSKGLRIHEDYSVSFHRSKFKGKRCYYIRWSSIEYVFVKE